ncbi:TonB-dependent receptor [Aestuariibacter sp. A3R04]|nr:TonB-dependent receptor [Aestuariibacter sp. A3R04]MBU3022355.1 TonB-dependent receptor [Aestuariibacter sp. A3R04]
MGLSMLAASWSGFSLAQQTFQFDINPQQADEALTEFAKQANTTLLFPIEMAERIKANGLSGTFTLKEGLQLLLAGTPLAVQIDATGMLVVKAAPERPKTILPRGPVTRINDNIGFSIERIAVVGTRSAPRSVVESPVPLDIIGINAMQSQGATDVLSMLSATVPSLNVNDQPINDAASLVRPANLRGMAADHTLILVNGKRRHRSAVITFLGGGLSDGAQGPDISVLPAASMKQVEVLRDGAAAQYGSDAIAGVINFVLDDEAEAGYFAVKTGQHLEGDGEVLQIQANKGYAMAEGFLNITTEYRQQNDTHRAVQRDDAQTLIDAGNVYVSSPAQNWGALEVNSEWKLAFNSETAVTDDIAFYSFATAARREVSGGFYYRHPQLRLGVFLDPNSPSSQLLVADLDGEGQGVTCPTVPIVDDNILDDPAYLLIADEYSDVGLNCFSFNEWFPGGFTPRFGGVIKDGAFFSGIRGALNDDWIFDLSGSIGYSNVRFNLEDTVNPSLGPASPTHFSPGAVSQVERTVNLDFSRFFSGWTANPISMALGVEWRRETYSQSQGDEASWIAGPFAQVKTENRTTGFGIGSNGFPGYQPVSQGHWSRHNWAIYGDIEFYLTENWQWAVALRGERFSDFGSTLDGKLNARYVLSDVFSLRGSVSSGFKAPTVGQSNVINITTAFSSTGLEDHATLPPTHPISQSLGAEPLTPESSRNFSMGVVAFWDEDLYLTLDYFNIHLTDRISTTSAIPLTDSAIAALVAEGHAEAANYNAIKYFANDFDTRTQGVDLVFNYRFEAMGLTHAFTSSVNWTDTHVERLSSFPQIAESGERILVPSLTPQRVRMLEENLPSVRGSMTLRQHWQAFTMLWRMNYYGSFYEDHLDAAAGLDINSGSTVTLDAEFTWHFSENTTLIFGASNLFNQFPDKNPHLGVAGALYPPTSPSGINGGFAYFQAKVAF